jgi:hypothetical protein
VTYRKGEAALDWWTWVHFGAGCLIGLTGLAWAWALAVIVVYELVEGGLRHIKTEEGGLFEYESWPNIFVDILVGTAGYFLAFFVSPVHWPF